MITFTQTHDPAAFSAAVRGYLLADEVPHNMLLGLLAEVAAPDGYPLLGYGSPVLVYAEGEGGIEAVALQTPPRNLVVSRSVSPGAIESLAHGLAVRQVPLPGVFGPAREARAFAAAWRGHTRLDVRQFTGRELAEANEIHAPSPAPPGRIRRAGSGDTALVARWLTAFDQEADAGDLDPAAAHRAAQGLVAHGRRSLSVWEDGDPPVTVSMAATGAHTAQGARISAVYTPPEHRRHGYASAIVAAVSQEVLDSGRSYVALFYDRTNLTAAHIYAALGFVRTASFDDYRFG